MVKRQRTLYASRRTRGRGFAGNFAKELLKHTLKGVPDILEKSSAKTGDHKGKKAIETIAKLGKSLKKAQGGSGIRKRKRRQRGKGILGDGLRTVGNLGAGLLGLLGL